MAARDFDAAVAEIAARLRLDVASNPSLLTLCNGWLNDVIQDIHSRHDWFWALDRQVVQTVADKTAGTVAVSAGSTSVVGTSTAFGSSDVGSYMRLSTTDDWYKISAVADASNLTLEAPYVDDSALSAGTYTIRKVFYSLPSAEKIISVKQAPTKRDLTCISHRDFDTYLAFADSTGKATTMCVYGLDGSNQLQFNIYPHADEIYNLEIKYKKVATLDTLASIPAKWRGVYIDGGMARGLEYVAMGVPEFKTSSITDKKGDYERGIKRMMSDAEPESNYHPVIRNTDVCNYGFNNLPDGLSIPLD